MRPRVAMAKHYTKKEPRFQIEFRPSEQPTAHGGQLAVNALFQQFGLWQRIQQAPALEVRWHKGKGYDPVVYAAQTLFCLTSGGVSVADAERLDEDASVKALLGLKKCPDQSALGQWLRQAGAAGVWKLCAKSTGTLCAGFCSRLPSDDMSTADGWNVFLTTRRLKLAGRAFKGPR